MVKKRILFKKLLSGSKNVWFEEFVALIEAFGFTLERISGSHHIFAHPAVPQTISTQSDQNGQASRIRSGSSRNWLKSIICGCKATRKTKRRRVMTHERLSHQH